LQIATEIPISALTELSALTDYDFVIGPVYRRFKEYADFYKKQNALGRYVILDNGAFEGELLEDEDLLDIAQELQPAEVVAPDVLYDRKATLDRVKGFLGKFKLLEGAADIKIQVCPCGQTTEEYVQSYANLVEVADVVGLTYLTFLEPQSPVMGLSHFGAESKRLSVLHTLVGRGLIDSNIPHHLLGLANLDALKHYAGMYPWIRSIDTSFPIAAAMEGRALGLYGRGREAKPSARMNYEHRLTSAEFAHASHNIQWMRNQCSTA